MAGTLFRRDVEAATGCAWEEWIRRLDGEVDKLWSHERIAGYIGQTYEVTEEWSEWIALLYEPLLGRVPTGTTKDAGVQIGVRRTMEAGKERIWRFLLSPQGAALWLGEVKALSWQKGEEFASRDGITGKLTVVDPGSKLRLAWKRPDWDKPSRLQLILLAASGGKTTVSIHQEMLEDVYMRERMRLHWDEVLRRVKAEAERAD
ncbi:MAG: SRPBCC domain-containing protein [Paenibacillaceae bacterium]|nr:SRPBCC domain-containing protein [Paenibacillaceae bacterium]